MEMKFCKDCKFHKLVRRGFTFTKSHECYRYPTEFNKVTGDETEVYQPCDEERLGNYEDKCGPIAIYFKPKEVK